MNSQSIDNQTKSIYNEKNKQETKINILVAKLGSLNMEIEQLNTKKVLYS